MKYFLLLLISSLVVISSCKSKKNTYNNSSSSAYSGSSTSETTSGNTKEYDDGDYCATVTYYNPKTGTRSTYQLTVEVESGEVTLIHWPNGGWFDNSHFNPEQLDEDGSASFTDDRGYSYTVNIDDDGPCNYASQNANSPAQQESAQQQNEEESERIHKGEDEGYVIWDHSGCDYVIIETRIWYVVAEKRSGAYGLSVGDKVRGALIGFGFEDVYDFSSDDEISLYIDNYYGTKSRAIEKVMDKCDLINMENQ